MTVAVIVVTRQQVAGIKRGGGKGGDAEWERGVQRGSLALFAGCCHPMGAWQAGVAGRQRVPTDWKRGTRWRTKSSSVCAHPVTYTLIHSYTRSHDSPSRAGGGGEGEQTGTGSKIQLIHDGGERVFGRRSERQRRKPQEMGKNTPLPPLTCVCVCCTIYSMC